MNEIICNRIDCACLEDECLCRALAHAPKDFAKCPFYKSKEQARREKRECRLRIESLPPAQQAHIRETYFGKGSSE